MVHSLILKPVFTSTSTSTITSFEILSKKMSFTDDHSSLPAGTIEWMERLRDPDEYSRALLRISPDKKWTKEDHKNPEYLARAFLLIEKVAKENAPTGVDPYEVDEVDVKAALLLGFSKEAATEHGRKEAVSRILKYTGDGIRKMEAKQE